MMRSVGARAGMPGLASAGVDASVGSGAGLAQINSMNGFNNGYYRWSKQDERLLYYKKTESPEEFDSLNKLTQETSRILQIAPGAITHSL